MILVGSQSIHHVPIVLPLQNYNTTIYVIRLSKNWIITYLSLYYIDLSLDKCLFILISYVNHFSEAGEDIALKVFIIHQSTYYDWLAQRGTIHHLKTHTNILLL